MNTTQNWDGTCTPPMTPWALEVASSRLNRDSPASSVVSTRTRYSITTLDDARSIEISAGGHSFRISRDGSQVTDTTAPPPYSRPSSVFHVDELTDFEEGVYAGEIADLIDVPDREDNATPRMRIAMPHDTESSIVMEEEDPLNAGAQTRVLSQEEFQQIALDLPTQLKKALGLLPPTLAVQRPGFGYDSRQQNIQAGRRTQSDTSTYSWLRPWLNSTPNLNEPSSELNAAHNLENTAEGFGNPAGVYDDPNRAEDFNRINAHLMEAERCLSSFKARDSEPGPSKLQYSSPLLTNHQNEFQTSSKGATHYPYAAPIQPAIDAQAASLTVGDINDVSLLYNRVIRDLDREHRRKLHYKDVELAKLRELFNEKDIVFRQQLRGKDFIIDDLKKSLAYQEEVMNLRLEAARNEVEDIWEVRWKDRDRLLMERMKRIEVQTFISSGSPGAASKMERNVAALSDENKYL